MHRSAAITDTVFLVKEEREHCFLFDADDPLDLLRTLMMSADDEEGGIRREEAYEMMEGLVPERLRCL